MKPSADLLRNIEAHIGGLKKWKHNCHAASLAIVKTGLLGPMARVARGWCIGVTSQHSWVVIGDPYDPDTVILDPTRWSYTHTPPKMIVTTADDPRYMPHGRGSIWDAGRPTPRIGPEIKLKGLSARARSFIHEASDGRGLDRAGWMTLGNSPMGGWPAKEIITAMYRHKNLGHLVPIDVVGMVTDENPGGLYMAETKKKAKA